MRIFAAEHVVPVAAPPIESGALAVEAGSIADIGRIDDVVGRHPGAEVIDFGEAAIIPGLVNCHSHLEITAMRGALDDVENDFRAWLLRLNSIRGRLSESDIRIAAVAGAVEGARAGVTCFGDIGRFASAGLEALKAVGLRGVVFQETPFSPDNRTADDDFERLKERFFELSEAGTGTVEAGISPHAPYTVSRELFEKISEFAVERKVKLTIHAAESSEEDELMRYGEGFFSEVYEKYGFTWEVPRRSSVAFLAETGVLKARPLLAHCVAVSADDIALIAESGSAVAHCPKSNAKFGHGTAPFEALFDAGIAVGFGSDSVASNNTCDIIEEARFAGLTARNRPGSNSAISAHELLRAATLGGAAALGLDKKIGSLELGKKADLAVISLAGIHQQPIADIFPALVFSSRASDTIATIVEGEFVFRDSATVKVDEHETKARLRRLRELIQAETYDQPIAARS